MIRMIRIFTRMIRIYEYSQIRNIRISLFVVFVSYLGGGVLIYGLCNKKKRGRKGKNEKSVFKAQKGL